MKLKFKSGIKSSLIIFYLIIVLLFFAQILYFEYLHFEIIGQYDDLIESLITENSISSVVPEFILSYNNLINSKSAERMDDYNQHKNDLENIFIELDGKITDSESKIAYRGLKNYVFNLIKIADDGIKDIEEGRLVASTYKYDDLVDKQFFLTGNVGNLITKELLYVKVLDAKIEAHNTKRMKIVLSFMFFSIAGSILFLLLFAKKIITPIIELSTTAIRIGEGKLDVPVSNSLRKRTDEIGILSRSFNSMLKRINSEIKSQKKTSANLVKSQKELTRQNNELEQFNSLIVGRELKMVELEKKLEKYESKKKKK